MPFYAYGDHEPQLHASAYVHPDAVIGQVFIGADASIWPTAVLRGDLGTITVGAGTSIQDGTIVPTTFEHATVIGTRCVVGHNTHIEGAIIEDGCLVASMSACLNGSHIGAGSPVAGGAFVPPRMQVPPRSRAVGTPARITPLDDTSSFEQMMANAVDAYIRHAQSYPHLLRQLDGRPRQFE